MDEVFKGYIRQAIILLFGHLIGQELLTVATPNPNNNNNKKHPKHLVWQTLKNMKLWSSALWRICCLFKKPKQNSVCAHSCAGCFMHRQSVSWRPDKAGAPVTGRRSSCITYYEFRTQNDNKKPLFWSICIHIFLCFIIEHGFYFVTTCGNSSCNIFYMQILKVSI